MTTIRDIANSIEKLAPLNYAEGFDNVGLLVGDYKTEVTGVLVTLDTLENVVDEAIEKNCNLIVSFHPIVFSGLKKINGSNYVERVVIKAIKSNIAIYTMHTALDNSFNGVNAKICDVLGLSNKHILIPQKNTIKKLLTYVPIENADRLRKAMFAKGAGKIGKYDNCSFNVAGFGTYRGGEDSNPTIGTKGVLHTEKEIIIGVIFEKHLEGAILKAMFDNHPYEEVAYEITTIENKHQQIGMGMIGEFENEMKETDFLNFVKKTLHTDCIRHSKLSGKKIKKVAVLGGSGSFAIEDAKRAGADAFISADFKYHEFYKAENQLLITDVGHYESEQFTKNLLVDYLTEKFTNFAIILSDKITNPIYYI
ncbi:Nif3-like dinuclear metal center hexameric protein [Flavicella marina]|uniref:Nif3-like dinuclear metal center hexameric protein n=1 Tax=Flavicella marina TaxID=1475951 RepID=UPI001263EC60|nr:Nif3-like dinuclear metal center hexameric protein [Flavicella marina]